jgi:hypothetical protein
MDSLLSGLMLIAALLLAVDGYLTYANGKNLEDYVFGERRSELKFRLTAAAVRLAMAAIFLVPAYRAWAA